MNECEHDFSFYDNGNWVCIHCGYSKPDFLTTELADQKVFSAVFNINIEYKIKAKNAEEAEQKALEFMKKAELPANYVSDSVEFVDVYEEE